MKNIIVFISGFIAGIFFIIFIGYIIGTYKHNDSMRNIPIQYIDIKGKKGYVKLHTGISKDSVKILVGRPDEVELNSIPAFNSTLEDWRYKLKDNYIPNLVLKFENGKLVDVDQK